MNIAFTTLVILLLATPGYIARSAYLTENFTREALPASNLTNEVVQAIIYSIPFHFATVAFLTHVPLSWTAPVSFDVVFRLLAGEYGDDGKAFASITGNLYAHVHHIALYFAVLSFAALLIGVTLRDIVWKYKLDVRLPAIFRYRNRWLYILTTREKTDQTGDYITVVDALCEQGGGTQLYRGMVLGFISNTEGELEDIYLGDAFRGVFAQTESGEQFEWHEIPGDNFVLKYAEIKNLNISYLAVPSQNQSGHPEPAADPRA
jgi:hypothetical protein